MREIADVVRDRLPDELGFAVLVFEFGGGPASYISNASRADMIAALREQADLLEQRRDFITPEEN
jgi:hypothetical protein